MTSAALPASRVAASASGLLREELSSTGASGIDSLESDRYHLRMDIFLLFNTVKPVDFWLLYEIRMSCFEGGYDMN